MGKTRGNSISAKAICQKIIYLVLMLSMVITWFSFTGGSADAAVVKTNIYADPSTWYESPVKDIDGKLYYNEVFLKDQYDRAVTAGKIPLQTNGQPYPLTISKRVGSSTYTYTLNYKILYQKNLCVYGSYQNIGLSNYFKGGYQVHTNLNNLQPDVSYEGGYFKKPTGVVDKGIEQNPDIHPKTAVNRGEWKYLGYDVSGNPFSNMWMINVATVTKFENRNWQPEPWKEPLNKSTGLTSGASEYNLAAYGNYGQYDIDTVAETKKWMTRTFSSLADFAGIPTKTKASGVDPDIYKYLYIQSPPTLKAAGSGRMWHKLSSTGELWYQTFSIPVQSEKREIKELPVNCDIIDASIISDIPETAERDSEHTILTFQLKATLNDEDYYEDAVKKTAYYTRYDLYDWTFNLNIASLGNIKKTAIVEHTDKSKNSVTTIVKVDTTIGAIRALPKATSGVNKGKREVFVNADATPKYSNDKNGFTGSTSGKYPIGTKVVPEPALPPRAEIVMDIPSIHIQNHIGEIAFDSVPFDDATDSTDMSAVKSKELYVDGQPVDYSTFFSGRYIFPDVTNVNGYFAQVLVRYNLDSSKISIEGLPNDLKEKIASQVPLVYESKDWVYVYPTKPNAQYLITSNTWKQNRIINVQNTSPDGNIQLVVQRFPITEYRWTFGGDTTNLHKGTDTDLQKQLQYSEPGTYSLTLQCKNSLGKWSDPYTVEYQVFEDYAPNIEVNLSDSVLARTDELTAWHYDVNSTDGDKIASARIELWYDSDNNGTLDQKIQEWDGLGGNGICEPDDFPKFTPTQLGYYKYKIYAKDEFVGVQGQDTLQQYITDADKKTSSYEVEFWVDNYQPLSDLYLETEIQRPNVDLYIMRDKNNPDEDVRYLTDNRVSMENYLLGKNILPGINIWDMKTYEYSTPASSSYNTGTSYPPTSISYSSAGYSGTLSRTSVSDNGSNHDFGHTETRTETKTASAGGRSTSGHGISGSAPPSSISYSDSEGYSGTLTGYGYLYTSVARSDKEGDFDWTRSYAGYSGTVSRTVSYWVPDIRWVSNYTGYYSGTIYKYVRQPYTDPWRANSYKYVMYISNSGMSEKSDFDMVTSKSDAKVILAGTASIKSQYPSYAKFIDVTGKSMQDIVNEALEFISQDAPAIEQMYMLQNQTFTLNTGEEDIENDNIVAREMQYVQDKDYFDNPTGQETGTQTVFSDTGGWIQTMRTSFANVGKYQIFRRVKDKPSGAYGEDYSYYSSATEVDIYVHRKPIAKAVLDWDFDAGTNLYRTKWVDLSYDMDHSISRTDKGIAQRKIMWKKEGGDWNYTIPDYLSPGTYRLRYYVMDIENTWSDVFTIDIDGTTSRDVTEVTFTLWESPPMQFEAKLRSEKLNFRTPESPVTVPASENLELYGIWTRYPTDPALSMALYNTAGIQAGTSKTVNFNTSAGTKNGNDINWRNILFNTSKTLPDGDYIFKVTASANQSKTISFPVRLSTPINLKGLINGKSENAQVNTGERNIFTFTTSVYVTSTQLTFEGKTYSSDLNQIRLISSNETGKTWECPLELAEGAYPDGKLGTAEFKATLPSGKSETAYVNYKIVGIRASGFLITMMLVIGWRPYYFNMNNGIDDNHDGVADRYPRLPNTDIGTLKLPVNFYSLVGYSRTYIKAGYKVNGRIDIQGNPDSAYFKAHYNIEGKPYAAVINLNKSSGNTYLFEWIIPIKTDSNSFINFDLVTVKGENTYGNEKWVDKWDGRNLRREVFYVMGNAMEDIIYTQSH